MFENIDELTKNDILNKIKPQIKDFKANDDIYTPESFEKKVGFVLSGECLIERVKSDGTHIPLNFAKSGDSFGIMSILSCDEEFPTRVTAIKNTRLLFISEEDLKYLISNFSLIALNLINFLAKKIEFLNKKIATFSSNSVEEKLANYLLIEFHNCNSYEFKFNCKKTAEAINSGRASLYRAISSLSEKGIISLENKKIIINDLKGLERISK